MNHMYLFLKLNTYYDKKQQIPVIPLHKTEGNWIYQASLYIYPPVEYHKQQGNLLIEFSRCIFEEISNPSGAQKIYNYLLSHLWSKFIEIYADISGNHIEYDKNIKLKKELSKIQIFCKNLETLATVCKVYEEYYEYEQNLKEYLNSIEDFALYASTIYPYHPTTKTILKDLFNNRKSRNYLCKFFINCLISLNYIYLPYSRIYKKHGWTYEYYENGIDEKETKYIIIETKNKKIRLEIDDETQLEQTLALYKEQDSKIKKIIYCVPSRKNKDFLIKEYEKLSNMLNE